MITSNFVNNFESANNVINSTKKERKDWHNEERTLSRLLRLCQEKKMMSFTTPIFKKAGLPIDGKLSQTKYLSYVVNFVDVKGEKLPAYVRYVPVYRRDEDGKCLKDKDGKFLPVLDKDGKPVTKAKLTPIKAGTWTLEKLIKAVAK